MAVISFLYFTWFFFHTSFDFSGGVGAGIRGILLVELLVEALSESVDEVLQDPHVALVDEAIQSHEHVTVDRAAHLTHLEPVSVQAARRVRLGALQAHLVKVVYVLRLLGLE